MQFDWLTNVCGNSAARSKIITLMNSLGENGSLFSTNYVRAIFEGVGVEPKISSSEHSVIVEVPV